MTCWIWMGSPTTTSDFASILCARPAGEAIRDFTISEWERVRHRVGA